MCSYLFYRSTAHSSDIELRLVLLFDNRCWHVFLVSELMLVIQYNEEFNEFDCNLQGILKVVSCLKMNYVFLLCVILWQMWRHTSSRPEYNSGSLVCRRQRCSTFTVGHCNTREWHVYMCVWRGGGNVLLLLCGWRVKKATYFYSSFYSSWRTCKAGYFVCAHICVCVGGCVS
jgi:hypothetical protein